MKAALLFKFGLWMLASGCGLGNESTVVARASEETTSGDDDPLLTGPRGQDDSGPAAGDSKPPPEPEAAEKEAIVGRMERESGVTVETLAGASEAGRSDGVGAAARFDNPVNLAVAPDGTVYVSDFDNSLIRRIALNGQVTTLPRPEGFLKPFGIVFTHDGRLIVGTDGNERGQRSYSTGTLWEIDPKTGAGAIIVSDIGRPRGLAPLKDGRIVVTDYAWHSVRLLDPDTAELKHLAGSRGGQAGFKNGQGDRARFFRPYGAVVTPDQTILLVDERNHCVRAVSLAGQVSTWAGTCAQRGRRDGGAREALFNTPRDLALDADGNVFISDLGNHLVRKIGKLGYVTTLAGSGARGYMDGPGTQASFYAQEGLDVSPDGTRLFVADGNFGDGGRMFHRVRLVSF